MARSRIVSAALASLISGLVLFFAANAYPEYISGMNWHEIRGFAEQVAEQKAIGVTLNEAVVGLRQSLGSEYRDTKRGLEKIIRAIYGTTSLSAATPEAVGEAYERSCELTR